MSLLKFFPHTSAMTSTASPPQFAMPVAVLYEVSQGVGSACALTWQTSTAAAAATAILAVATMVNLSEFPDHSGPPPSVKRVQHESTDYVTLLEPRPLPRSLHVDMETKFGDDRRPDAGSSPRERTAGPVGKTAVPVKLHGSQCWPALDRRPSPFSGRCKNLPPGPL